MISVALSLVFSSRPFFGLAVVRLHHYRMGLFLLVSKKIFKRSDCMVLVWETMTCLYRERNRKKKGNASDRVREIWRMKAGV